MSTARISSIARPSRPIGAADERSCRGQPEPRYEIADTEHDRQQLSSLEAVGLTVTGGPNGSFRLRLTLKR